MDSLSEQVDGAAFAVGLRSTFLVGGKPTCSASLFVNNWE